MKNIVFILFHTGETRALLPSIQTMVLKPDKYNIRIIPVGQAAYSNLPKTLNKFIKIPEFINEGKGNNDESKNDFLEQHIQQVVELCKNYDNVVIGYPAKIQEQIAMTLFNQSNNKIIIYFDNGSDENKIRTFSFFSHVLIFTTLQDQMDAINFISNQNLNNQIEIFSSRHGDFDLWTSFYNNLTEENKNEIRKKLFINSSDKIILWAGSHGDKEEISFKMFIEHFKNYPLYPLRITLHPGLLTYSQTKLEEIKNIYYINTLKYFGYSNEEINKIMTSLSTQEVASVAFGFFSAGSSSAKIAVHLGVHAKSLILNNQLLFKGIKNIDTPEKLSQVFNRWEGKNRRQLDSESYKKSINKLGIPEENTKDVLKKCTI